MRSAARLHSRTVRRKLGILTVAWFFPVLIASDPALSQEGVATKPGDEIVVEFKGKKQRAKIRTVNITMDLNNDGRIDGRDDRNEDKLSAVVICDRDDVYIYQKNEDKFVANDEPAQRQLMIVQNEDPRLGAVTLERSSQSLRVFRSKSGNDEVAFRANRSGSVESGRYWVQGGSDCSLAVGDEFLRATPRQWLRNGGRMPSDNIDLTIIWVDIEAREAGPRGTMLAPPLYEYSEIVKKTQGHSLLGVQRSTSTSKDTDRKVRAIVEIIGTVNPSRKFSSNVFGREFLGIKGIENRQADTDFGFIFRRWAKAFQWFNGIDEFGNSINIKGWPPDPSVKEFPKDTSLYRYFPDDSPHNAQDTRPNRMNNRFLIVDNDGPGTAIQVPPDVSNSESSVRNFIHLRVNFVEHVVFKRWKGAPAQRVSRRMKWAVSLDFGRDYQDRAVFVRGRPNSQQDGQGAISNIILTEEHIPKEELTLNLKKPVVESVRLIEIDGNPASGNELPWGKDVSVLIKGRNLIGRYEFIGVDRNIPEENWSTFSLVPIVRVKPDSTGLFSETDEVRITFRVSLPSSTILAIRAYNHAGSSKPVGRFNIIGRP